MLITQLVSFNNSWAIIIFVWPSHIRKCRTKLSVILETNANTTKPRPSNRSIHCQTKFPRVSTSCPFNNSSRRKSQRHIPARLTIHDCGSPLTQRYQSRIKLTLRNTKFIHLAIPGAFWNPASPHPPGSRCIHDVSSAARINLTLQRGSSRELRENIHAQFSPR